MKSRHPIPFENFGIERTKPLESAAFFLLLVFIVAAPFPWGAVLAGGKLKIELFAFAIGTMILASRATASALRPIAIPAGALALLALFGALQVVPLGDAVVKAIAPFSASVYADTNAILALYGRAPLAAKISLAPADTIGASLLIAAYASLLVSSAVLLQSRRRRRVFVGIVVTNAAIQSMFAAATFGPRSTGRISGPFVNPNHFAGYLEVALGLAFAILWREVLYNRERGRGAKDGTDTMERQMMPLAAAIFAWGIIATGIGLTRSRGGIAAAVLTTFALVFVALMHQKLERRTRLGVTIGSVLLCAIALTSIVARDEPIVRYLESDPREIGSDMRIALYRASFDAWRQSPNVGTGLGSFREAFRYVQPREIVQLVEQAHSDPLQLLVTGGWIGLLLGAVAVGSALLILIRLWRAQPHREESALALGGIGSIACLLVHGLVEFNFSIPAIPATLACVAGLAIAAGAYGTKE